MAITLLSRMPNQGVGAVCRPSAPPEPAPKKVPTKHLWEVQGIIPGTGELSTVVIAFGRVVVNAVFPLSPRALILRDFILGENCRPETWEAHFCRLTPDHKFASVEAGEVIVRSPKALVEYAQDGDRHWISEDEGGQILRDLKVQKRSEQLGAEKLAREDWARRFPDIRYRPIPTGQTQPYLGKYPAKEKK